MCNNTVVLTGATGFLGAFLMAGLLERGYHVTVLGRSSRESSLASRLKAIVRWLDVDTKGRLYSIEADFSKKQMGLDGLEYSRLCANADQIIHCASDTSFSQGNRERVMAANVGNLSVLLDFAADSRARRLHYVSTAYVSGRCSGLCMEAPVAPLNFTNVYEESKAMAEGIVRLRCESIGLPLVLLRPSIVYGHSMTGKSLKFNALYYALKSLLMVRDIFVKDILEQGGKRSQKWGFSLLDDGTLHMPLNVYMPGNGSVNLISVDHFVDATLCIIKHPQSEGIYHITCDDPPEISALMEYGQRFAKVSGLKALWNGAGKNALSNPAEEMFDRLMEPYRPYFSDGRIFDRSRTKMITNGLATPPLTYDIFERCMAYALTCDWGRAEGFPR